MSELETLVAQLENRAYRLVYDDDHPLITAVTALAAYASKRDDAIKRAIGLLSRGDGEPYDNAGNIADTIEMLKEAIE